MPPTTTAIVIGGSVRCSPVPLHAVQGPGLGGGQSGRVSSSFHPVPLQSLHFDFPRVFGESDMNTDEGTFHTSLGKFWTFSLSGGVVQAEVQGLQQVAVDPVIAALLSPITVTFATRNL